ncbi:MAG: CRISPR-associated ring nuclease Crn3/Csx3 [bacterium]|nr:CRISPR-associated ring nuclease Crn3/Csx3 [bacterium]
MNSKLILESTPEDFQILTIEIGGNGLVEPADIKGIQLPEKIDFTKGVLISGKAPVWFYAALVHKLHISKWVATLDPRIGAIVVQSHDKNSPQTGDIIPFEKLKNFLK